MGKASQIANGFRFGVFELDLLAGELRKNGLKVRLQDQPFQILCLLVERPGQIVTREELREKLWSTDTIVDFDHSLNAAINKLREALGDSATHPRFIETVPRRGYRLLSPVERVGGASESAGSPWAGVAGDVQPAAGSLGEHSSQDLVPQLRLQRRALLVALVALGGLCVALVAALWLRSPPGTADEPVRKFAFATKNFPIRPLRRLTPISPDGRHIAYVSGQGRKSKLWIQDFDREEPRELDGTEGASGPFWSPDSQFVGFAAGDELKKISVHGGRALTLCRMAGSDFWGGGATWSPDGASIVFSSAVPARLYEVPAAGGSAKLLFGTPDKALGLFPHFLPLKAGGRTLLFTRGLGSSELVLRDLDTEREEVLGAGIAAAFSPTGHLLYQVRPGWLNPCSSVLWALPFSLETRKATGEAFVVRQNASHPSVANDNTLVYLEDRCGGGQRLIWCDRNGKKLGEIGQPQNAIRFPALSPDERWVAATSAVGGSAIPEIWIHDTTRLAAERLTLKAWLPTWSPDGKAVTYTSNRNGNVDIFSETIDGSQEVTPLLATSRIEEALCWSPDGRHLLHEVYNFSVDNTSIDMWYLQRREEGKGWDDIPFLQTPFTESLCQFSPDGRFVAYTSDRSGRFEVYVRKFPEGADRQRVSTHGGTWPRWRKDGKELFYVEEDTLIAVSVTTEPSFSVVSSTRLFTHRGLIPWGEYDVSRDGQRFVVRELEQEPPVIRVVENWFEEFRDRQPTK